MTDMDRSETTTDRNPGEITRREALKKGTLLGGAALLWTTPTVQSFGMSGHLAAAVSGPRGQGCTPGFWKNWENAWPVPTSQTITETFGATTCAAASSFGADSLLTALSYGGGGGVGGGAQILLRAAAAAYLNASHPGVAYALSAGAVTTQVKTALDSCNRDTMLALAGTLDSLNNSGCPDGPTLVVTR